MTADIKRFSDIVRTEHSNLPLVAFEHSIGLGADASHVQNHGALLAGAILCGTLGAIPGLDQTRYATAIRELHAFAIGPDASLPSQFFGSLLVGFNAPFIANVPNPTGSELAKDRTRAPRPDAPLSRPPSGSPDSSVHRAGRRGSGPPRRSAAALAPRPAAGVASARRG